jgi:hypothetical protein
MDMRLPAKIAMPMPVRDALTETTKFEAPTTMGLLQQHQFQQQQEWQPQSPQSQPPQQQLHKLPMKIDLQREAADARIRPAQLLLPAGALGGNVVDGYNGKNNAPAQAILATPVSIGSETHGTGNCRPCAWFWKPGSCQNDRECHHCHLCPQGELKARKKSKLNMMRLGLATPQSGDHSQEDDVSVTGSFGLPKPDGCDEAISGFGLAHIESHALSSGSELDESAAESTALGSRQESQNSESIASSSEHEVLQDAASGDLPELQGSLAFGARRPIRSKELSTPPPAEIAAALDGPRTPSSSDCGGLTIFPPGLEPPCGTPSHGSSLHGAGRCRPCAWHWKPGGCTNATSCSYCHLCPEGELKTRKKSKLVSLRTAGATPTTSSSPEQEQEAKYALSLAACV